MARGKRYQLRQIEVAVANGKTTAQACKEAGIVEQSRLAGRQGPSATYLASRRTESTEAAEAARAVMAQRRLVSTAETDALQPCCGAMTS